MIERATAFLPAWALLAGLAAVLVPEPFVSLRGAIAPLLGLVMLGMGFTLEARDFRSVLERPGVVALGVALQYGIMPFLGWALAGGLGLPAQLAAGVVLVGSCPGGTASNVIAYLARGDVALSITLTTLTTLLAAVATPALTWLYAGERVVVPVLDMLASIWAIVLAPVLAGIVVNTIAGARLARVKHAFPLVSVAAIGVIIAIVVALNRERLGAVIGVAGLAVVLHNGLGLALGWSVARLLGRDDRERRTLAIEVGMQNSGLAVALASAHFSPLAAVPGALFSVWHNLSGALLASWWSRRPPRA